MGKVLEVKNLRISFRTGSGAVQAVRDVSFALEQGETLCIVGESGSGKSAMARAILGLLAGNGVVEGGEILYRGRDLLQATEAELNKIRGGGIAMIFQDSLSSLNPTMPVGRQLTEAVRLGGAAKREAYDKAIRIMEDVGIKEPEKRFKQYPFELSGGLRQRIVIAMAIAADPEVLVCDEPTTALDVTIQAQILELIREIKGKRKLSVIFITHDLGVVANMADKVAVMYAGKIVEYGTAEDVFDAPAHPYTWALLAAMPDLEARGKLEAIPGAPPDMTRPPEGDAFARRSRYAMEIDFEREPPRFPISDTHWAAAWLLHPDAPKVEPPKAVTDRIRRRKEREGARDGNG